MQTKRTLQEKFVTLYDTAKKCLLILDYLYRKIEEGSLAAEDGARVEQDLNIVIDLYISVLSFVDYLHRFHEIVAAMPLLRKDAPELKRLFQIFAPVDDVRNYLQHMRGDLMANEPLKFPILGGIAWIRGTKNYMLLSDQPIRTCEAPGIAFDRLENRYVCRYQLCIGGHELQLDTVYEEAKRFWKWLDAVSVIQPMQIKEFTWGKPWIVHSELVMKSSHLPETLAAQVGNTIGGSHKSSV